MIALALALGLQAAPALPRLPLMVTASDFVRMCQSDDLDNLSYCLGFAAGSIAAAGDIADAASGAAMFCLPERLTLGEVVDQAVMDVTQNRSLWATTPAGALIYTLIERYPCDAFTSDE